MALSKPTREEILDLLSREADFERSSISGRKATKDSQPRQGEMPAYAYRDLTESIRHGQVHYVVSSYATPIAWVTDNGVVLPDVTYSTTTSVHQKLVRQAFPTEVKAEAPATEQTDQYAELGEDDLISLASDLSSRLSTIHGEMVRQDTTLELVAVVGALKARRDASAPVRARIGEYLRQQDMVETQRQTKLKSPYSSQTADKEPFENIDELHADPYVPTAVLRLSDLAQVVQPLVRDTESEFFAEQQARLAVVLEHNPKLPQMQQNILRCVAEGHYRSSRGLGGSHAYFHRGDCANDRGNGNTMNALLKRGFVTTYTVAYQTTKLMLKKPSA